MSLLQRVIYAAHCRSTHHKLAIDALTHLRCPRPLRWRDMFLQHHEAYLTGSKDPDTKFKDFRNHVLHVAQNNWGGAAKKARQWYDRTVDALKHRDWADAAYCAGVLSHYYTDPLMPFHTGQSQAESNIHRATEWSICKSYDELRRMAVEQVGLPEIDAPRGDDWLEAMVIDGANTSHRCYDALVTQYDFAAGVKNPPAGLNNKCRTMLAKLLGHAAVGFACILDEAIEEADVRAPRSDLTVAIVLATVKVPIRWVTKKMADAEDRATVEAMYREFEETGKVVANLPEDDRAIRDLVAKELGAESSEPAVPEIEEAESGAAAIADEREPMVHEDEAETVAETERHSILSMHVSEDAADEERVRGSVEELQQELDEDEREEPLKTVDEEDDSVRDELAEEPESQKLRFYLQRDSNIVDAPSIGPKTAKRLRRIGVHSVDDLLQLDPDEAAASVDARHITAEVLADWQDQAALVCCIPQLRGHDSQILVACGYRDVESVAAADVGELLAETEEFAATSEGARVIRSSKAPDRAEVTNWIDWAQQARPLRAA